MKDNFAPSLALVLQHEGGFVDDPRDPGGRTNKGVTQAVYDDWRRNEGLGTRDVKLLNDYETGAIYRKRYWEPIRGDDLPAGVDYCVFDFAVNSGTNRASRFLQRALGVADDGKIGPATLTAVAATEDLSLIDQVSNLRLAFLQSLNTWKFFGRGWGRRVEEVRAKAKEMAR